MIQTGQAVHVPARYEFYLRSVIEEALQAIKRDEAEPGSSPQIPDFVVFDQKQGEVVLLLLDRSTSVVTVRDALEEIGRVAA